MSVSDTSARLVTTLKRVDETANYEEQPRPAEVNDRMVETDFARLLTIAQNALDEFTWAVDDEPAEVNIVGLTIVGSFLTKEFEPHKSDLDIYLLTEQDYEHGDAYCRMLLDPQSEYRDQLYGSVPERVGFVDPLGLSVIGTQRNFIRDPSITLRINSKSKESRY